ncbi:hypothetical protein [Streptomyces youssoufiensis]
MAVDVQRAPEEARWTLDKKGAKFKDLTKSEEAAFDAFQNAIHNEGKHPREAAKEARDANYKKLQGDQYQIRLSGGSRATFLVQEATMTVKVLQVGGHT